ncbi:MAG TPA: adenylate kinase [Candidatus Binatia bacterium]|nr:adenylate kinase [Candidatus Binatia bacterium]
MASVRVVLLGPPGAGKGTQGKLLRDRFEACQISTGDILRKAVADKTPLGKEAESYLSRGELVPDDVIVRLVGERLKQKDCANGFVLDGFPRTLPQAESLEGILKTMALPLDAVLSIQVPHDVIVERLAGRRNCQNCGALYHVNFDPPSNGQTCDRCDGGLQQRDDDREETIITRLRVYESQTAPLANYYRDRGKLREINGVGKVEDIQKRIIEAVGRPAS